jgi:ABC-type multidrug transport system ATPase subunit
MQGKTIISTIHQPSSDIFHMFDKFMLMADGQVVYYGLASESTKFFADQDLICPPLDNPADYYMQILHLDNSNNLTNQETAIVEKLAAACKKINIIPEPSRTILTSKSHFKSSFQEQLFYLTQKEFLRFFRISNQIFLPVDLTMLKEF